MKPNDERHVNNWGVRVERRYHPHYTFGSNRRYDEPFPPVNVQVSAEFDNNEAALDFERKVRELLENA